jgi:hypothetical protein
MWKRWIIIAVIILLFLWALDLLSIFLNRVPLPPGAH